MEETIRQTILYLRDVLKLSFYQIHRSKTKPGFREACLAHISRILSGQVDGPSRDSLLAPYRPLIQGWFKDHPTFKAQQVHQWLTTRGANVIHFVGLTDIGALLGGEPSLSLEQAQKSIVVDGVLAQRSLIAELFKMFLGREVGVGF